MGKFQPSIKAGALFPGAARSSFVELTRSRYAGMVERMKKKKLPVLSFTLEEFRADIVQVMGGVEDGVVICRYCNQAFTLAEIGVDHGTPLSRGGSAGLENIDYPCRSDNNRKGSMTIAEYQSLLAFLETVHPLMRKDVLSRLEKANSLAAGARRAQMLAAKFKQQPGTAPSPVEDDDGMPPF